MVRYFISTSFSSILYKGAYRKALRISDPDLIIGNTLHYCVTRDAVIRLLAK